MVVAIASSKTLGMVAGVLETFVKTSNTATRWEAIIFYIQVASSTFEFNAAWNSGDSSVWTFQRSRSAGPFGPLAQHAGDAACFQLHCVGSALAP